MSARVNSAAPSGLPEDHGTRNDGRHDLLPLPDGYCVRKVDVSEGYRLWAPSYDTSENPLIEIELPAVRKLMPPPHGRRVLDVGCGTGRHLEWLSPAAGLALGIDPSAGMLERARFKGLEVRLGALPNLPVGDGTFDAVVCALVLEHVPDLGEALRDIRRVLVPGGSLVVSSFHPALCSMGMPVFFDDPGDRMRYVIDPSVPHFPSEYHRVARESGFVLEELMEKTVTPSLALSFSQVSGKVGFPLLLALRLRRKA